MTKIYQQVSVFSLILCTLASCVPSGSPTEVVFITPSSAQTARPSVTPSKTGATITTQSTDEELKLSIARADENCFVRGEPVQLTIVYENLTNVPLKIVDFDFISNYVEVRSAGFLHPELTTLSNEALFVPHELENSYGSNPDSPVFFELSPNSAFEVLVNYFVPDKLASKGEIYAIQPGHYLLAFEYFAHEINGSWEGAISTNQIEICISE